MRSVKTVFPDQRTKVALLCSLNPTFAQICSDHELLVGLLPKDADDPSVPDIQESLSALEEEIRLILEHPDVHQRNR